MIDIKGKIGEVPFLGTVETSPPKCKADTGRSNYAVKFYPSRPLAFCGRIVSKNYATESGCKNGLNRLLTELGAKID